MLLILRDIMSKFMYSGSYTSDGVKGLLKEGGTARRDETKRIVINFNYIDSKDFYTNDLNRLYK